MARLTTSRMSEGSPVALTLVLLIPRVAAAGWGDERWGEMVWGGGAPAVPSMDTSGLVAIGIALAAVTWALLRRMRRDVRSEASDL